MDVFIVIADVFPGLGVHQLLCLSTVCSSDVYGAHFPLWKVETKADKPLDIMAFAPVIEISVCSGASLLYFSDTHLILLLISLSCLFCSSFLITTFLYLSPPLSLKLFNSFCIN